MAHDAWRIQSTTSVAYELQRSHEMWQTMYHRLDKSGSNYMAMGRKSLNRQGQICDTVARTLQQI